MTGVQSSGASGGSLHGGGSFKVEKAPLAAWKKGPENCKSEFNEMHCAPPSVPAPEALYDTIVHENNTKH